MKIRLAVRYGNDGFWSCHFPDYPDTPGLYVTRDMIAKGYKLATWNRCMVRDLYTIVTVET